MKKIIKMIMIIILILIITSILLNLYIISTTKEKIYNVNEINDNDFDCILILGAGVRANMPSPMLEDRLLTGLELYNKKLSNKIVVSGDHGRVNYDEVNIMKNYLIEKGVPSEDIFMDHAGFSTYDSIYRVKEIFTAKKVIIVTQKYHLYRSLHISKKLELEAIGVIADKRNYYGQFKREIREVLARIKDIIKCLFKPNPKYLGNIIPVNGNGNITNDK